MIFINDMAWRVREEFQRNQPVWSSKFVWIVDKDVGNICSRRYRRFMYQTNGCTGNDMGGNVERGVYDI